MVVFNRAPVAKSLFSLLGVGLWMACLVTSATAAVVLEAPQIMDQYTSGPE